MSRILTSFLLLLLILPGLTGCQTGLQTRSNLFQALSGGDFNLLRDITVPAGRVRVVFQGGALVRGVDDFYPRCELEVMKFSEAPQTVPAGTYRIGRVVGMTNLVKQSADNVMLAASIGFGMNMGSAQWIMEAYRMTLHWISWKMC